MGYDLARRLGWEQSRGFLTYHARFDLALLLDLCGLVGASLADKRVADLVDFVKSLLSPYGLWCCEPHPDLSGWLTFHILRSLAAIVETGCWRGQEPRTPFQPYPKKPGATDHRPWDTELRHTKIPAAET
ncbi:hypothetical protein JW905_11315 [bacterium]|nr:hypothetical protein [candidate division CSSED10-310 bacterium]